MTDLVSGAEAARRLGVSSGRVSQLTHDPASRFPRPVASVGRANVFAWRDVERWARRAGHTASPPWRSAGPIIGLAIGDALGAPYEFGWTTPPATGPLPFDGGGLGDGKTPGGWTDDTCQAAGVLYAIRQAAPLTTTAGQTAVATGLLAWHRDGPPNIGFHTEKILSTARTPRELAAITMAEYQVRGAGATNGALMRTPAVAYAAPGQPRVLARAARKTARLTHAHPDSVDACVLLTLAVDHAAGTGQIDMTVGLAHVSDPGRRRIWERQLSAAIDDGDPSQWTDTNGLARPALLAAAASLANAGTPVQRLEAAIRAGGDTDTVAAVTGSVLGAAHGTGAFPIGWIDLLHGPAYDTTGNRHQLTGGDLAAFACPGMLHGAGNAGRAQTRTGGAGSNASGGLPGAH